VQAGKIVFDLPAEKVTAGMRDALYAGSTVDSNF
jgi:hypothetical protein